MDYKIRGEKMDNRDVTNTANAMASLLGTQAVSLGRLITENQDLNNQNIKLNQKIAELEKKLKNYESE